MRFWNEVIPVEDKLFSVERRCGPDGPIAHWHYCSATNSEGRLPVPLPVGQMPVILTTNVADDLRRHADRLSRCAFGTAVVRRRVGRRETQWSYAAIAEVKPGRLADFPDDRAIVRAQREPVVYSHVAVRRQREGYGIDREMRSPHDLEIGQRGFSSPANGDQVEAVARGFLIQAQLT